MRKGQKTEVIAWSRFYQPSNLEFKQAGNSKQPDKFTAVGGKSGQVQLKSNFWKQKKYRRLGIGLYAGELDARLTAYK